MSGLSRRCLDIAEFYINEQIRDKEVRLLDTNGDMLGVVSGKEAQRLAEEKNLDLVKISPKANPPVCKIMDFSKFKFEQAKKERENRKKQKNVETKELWLSPNIDGGDIQVRLKRAIEFLSKGDKVKVTVRFRYGREMGRTDVGQRILIDFAKSLEEYATVDKLPKLDGRRMSMFLLPKPQDAKKKDKPAPAEKTKDKPEENQ
ncbi:MAG: translation initiation factor IF-3 [Defluviitaleaceae bacterium]|nr:translation initiation factor IF-3 [Defluviitaleaceae bacterium]